MRRLYASSPRWASIRPCGHCWAPSRLASSSPVAAASPRRPRPLQRPPALRHLVRPPSPVSPGRRSFVTIANGPGPRPPRAASAIASQASAFAPCAPPGTRWYVWDPTTDNFAYVSRNALSLPAELTRDDDLTGPPAKAVVSCVDRSSSYRFTSQSREAIGKWIQDSAHPGDLFYERWIEDNSYRPEAEIVPAIRVPLEPTRLPAPPPTPGQPNPFDRDRVAQATATVGAIRTVEARASATRYRDRGLGQERHLAPGRRARFGDPRASRRKPMSRAASRKPRSCCRASMAIATCCSR